MTEATSNELICRLESLCQESEDIDASMLVSVDGLTIASALPKEIEESRISAMSAALLSLSQSIVNDLNKGTLEQVSVKGNLGYVVLMAIGQSAVLTVLAGEQAKIGMVTLVMKHASVELAACLQRLDSAQEQAGNNPQTYTSSK